MLKTYIIMLVSCIVFYGNVAASEQQKQEGQNHRNQGVKKTPESNAIQTLHPIKPVHGPVIKIYEDGTRETDYNDGTGTILVEHCQGFYYYLHADDNRFTKK